MSHAYALFMIFNKKKEWQIEDHVDVYVCIYLGLPGAG